MARVLFADSVFWIALTHGREDLHQRAQAWRHHIVRMRTRLVTTEPVLWEWLNSLSSPGTRLAAVEGYERCRADSSIEVVSVTEDLCAAAVRLYRARTDKGWSLTDCLSFVVMQERSLPAALTADRDFQQAGLQALLLEEPPES